MSLFGRVVIFEIIDSNGVGRQYRDIRVGFDIRMDDEGEPNEAKIEAYNLAPSTISLLQGEGAVVRLSVGYLGDVPRLIFAGNPSAGGVTLKRRPPDRVLVVEGKDGGDAYKGAAVSLDYATPTTYAAAFAAVSDALGLPVGKVELPDGIAFPLGWTVYGPARDALDEITRRAGARWTIRDGALYVVPSGETTGEEAVVFSVEAGNLLGSPEPKDDGSIKVRALIAPSIRPGKPFVLDALDYRGTYRATEVRFRGDSGYDNPFEVEVVGEPV